jgi:hypothetical protein
MAIAFMQEFAATGDTSTTNYDAIAAKISEGPWTVGNLIHTAGFAPDGTFRIFDVWETKEQLDAFMNNTLGPLLGQVMAAQPDLVPPTKEETYELHDVATERKS